MSESDQVVAEENTYRAIGRFIFEFSQVEYTIRHYLAGEIGLHEEHFAAVVESYEVGMLCSVAIEVLQRAGRTRVVPAFKNSSSVSKGSMTIGSGSCTVSGFPSWKAAPCASFLVVT